MQVDETLVSYIAGTYYDIRPITGSIEQLCGYSDRNFKLTDSSDLKTYVLKIVNREESVKELTDIIDELYQNASNFCRPHEHGMSTPVGEGLFVVARVKRTTGNKLSTYTTIKYASTDEQDSDDCYVDVKCNIKMFEFFDGVTMFDYINGTSIARLRSARFATYLSRENLDKPQQLYARLGSVCNELFVFLRTQNHLKDQLRAVRGRSFPWQLETCEPHLRQLLDHLYPQGGRPDERRKLVGSVLDEYLSTTKGLLDRLPEFIIHGDLCNRNILLNWEKGSQDCGKFCLIDFQDIQIGHQVVELAVLMLYQVIEQERMSPDKALRLIPYWIYSGYQTGKYPLQESELMLVPSLMKLRLCQSLLNGQKAFSEDPKNIYVMQTNQRGWRLLEVMCKSESRELAASWQLES